MFKQPIYLHLKPSRCLITTFSIICCATLILLVQLPISNLAIKTFLIGISTVFAYRFFKQQLLLYKHPLQNTVIHYNQIWLSDTEIHAISATLYPKLIILSTKAHYLFICSDSLDAKTFQLLKVRGKHHYDDPLS